MNYLEIDPLLIMALKEDINNEDITTNAIMKNDKKGKAFLYAKEDGIICGLDIFSRVYSILDPNMMTKFSVSDGDEVKKGMEIGFVEGSIKVILEGERTALNYLQRMSGIATKTRKIVNLLKGTNIKLLDTRKTTPNMRIFEKYAVRIGGGINHRYNLSDGILIKDNHIDAAGSITNAINLTRAYAGYVHRIEVEVESLSQVKEAIEAKADIIMLDNMDKETMLEAIKIIDKKAMIECSGNMDYDKIELMKEIGVDYISSGALTHSAPILDLSLKHLKVE